MNFEYCISRVVGADIEVDDIGNTAIRGYSYNGCEYYIVIKTELGWTEIFEFGPVVPDIQQLPKSVVYAYDRLEYSGYKISKRIERFLNNNPVTSAEVIDFETAKQNMRNLSNYI